MRRDGRLEPPRATDPDDDGWDLDAPDPCRTEGFVVDHAAAVGLSEGIGRAGLLQLAYTADRFPADVRADSHRAVTTHPGVVLLPTTFRVVQRKEASWSMVTGQHSTPQRRRSTSGPRRSSWHAAGPTNSSCGASGSR